MSDQPRLDGLSGGTPNRRQVEEKIVECAEAARSHLVSGRRVEARQALREQQLLCLLLEILEAQARLHDQLGLEGAVEAQMTRLEATISRPLRRSRNPPAG